MEESQLRIQSFHLAKTIVLQCRMLRQKHVESALVNQLLRSGTSIGANIYEAQHAQSRKDFISKLEVSLKECSESLFWLNLLHELGDLSDEAFHALFGGCESVRRMLISSVSTLKRTLGDQTKNM